MPLPNPTPPRFDTVAAFMAWADGRPEKCELHDGIAIAMAPERADHARIKLNAAIALRTSLRNQAIPCEAMIDGLMVPGPGLRRFIPDVLVSCGDRLNGDAQLAAEPVILMEILSPSTEITDTSLKLESYFALPTVQHYLLVSTSARLVIHHRRWDGDRILTTLHRLGTIDLTPPGLSITLDDIYEATDVYGT